MRKERKALCRTGGFPGKRCPFFCNARGSILPCSLHLASSFKTSFLKQGRLGRWCSARDCRAWSQSLPVFARPCGQAIHRHESIGIQMWMGLILSLQYETQKACHAAGMLEIPAAWCRLATGADRHRATQRHCGETAQARSSTRTADTRCKRKQFLCAPRHAGNDLSTHFLTRMRCSGKR